MENRQQPNNLEARRRKLDDVFGDDPYLSPTMKARGLHEKANLTRVTPTIEISDSADQLPVAESRTGPKTANSAGKRVAPSVKTRLRIICFGETAREDVPAPDITIPFGDAVARLRAGISSDAGQSSHAEQLLKFQTEILMLWLKGAPSPEGSQSRRSRVLASLS